MSDITGNEEEEYELTLKILAQFDELKKERGDEADIEIILTRYPKNIRASLRKTIESYQDIISKNTPTKNQADFQKLQLLMYGTLGQQAQVHLETGAIDNLKNILDITALTQSSTPLGDIRIMTRNQQLNLGKQFGLKLGNIQSVRLWLEWLAKATGI